MFEKVRDILAKQLRIDPANISEDSRIKNDLGADSLDILQLLMSIEEEYNVQIPDEELATFEEAAGCGTAVVITPISNIDVKPVLEEDTVTRSFRYGPDGSVGATCQNLYKQITGIQFGEIEDTHGWCHYID